MTTTSHATICCHHHVAPIPKYTHWFSAASALLLHHHHRCYSLITILFFLVHAMSRPSAAAKASESTVAPPPPPPPTPSPASAETIQRQKQAASPELPIAVHLPGDIILGGLFPVHEKGDERQACGPTVYQRGVQRLEAMLYAVDRVNNDPDLLPNIRLGVHILDTCSRDTYALNQSLQFVRSSLNNLDASAAFECADSSIPRTRKNAVGPVFGVIGGSYSSVSLQVANLLRLFHIPQISPASTAKALSDKSRFDLFARTVPPDTFQSAALVDIVKALNWSYVSSIYSEGSYGEYGIEQFHKDAGERNVCIAIAEKVPSAADDQHFDAIIRRLLKKPNARGVILFTRAEDARRILMAAKRANLSQPFYWIASDGWGKQLRLVDGIEDVAEGAITVELQSEFIQDFDDYMVSLTPATNTRNPWFEEFWEDTFGCKLAKNFPVIFRHGENDQVCNASAKLSDKVG